MRFEGSSLAVCEEKTPLTKKGGSARRPARGGGHAEWAAESLIPSLPGGDEEGNLGSGGKRKKGDHIL